MATVHNSECITVYAQRGVMGGGRKPQCTDTFTVMEW